MPTTLAPDGRRLRRNTASMVFNQGGRVFLQGAYFVLAARTLGIEGFGAFAGTVALVALLAPFGSLGTPNLMIRHVAINRDDAPRWYATALAVTTIASSVLIALLLLLAPWVAPREVPLAVIAVIAVSELLAARLIDIAGAVFQATEQMFRTAIFPLLLYLARLLAASVAVALPGEVSLRGWVLSYLIGSVVVVIPVVGMTTAKIGACAPDIGAFAAEWRRGLLFACSLASQSVYNDIDKAVLGRLSTLEAVSIYTAAYRVVDMAFTPMRALLAASYARFFQHGEAGLEHSLRFARQIAKPGVAYCLFASFSLAAFADVVPVLLGSSFEEAVDVLRALALLPLLKALHYLAADALTGADYQGLRTVVQVVIAGLNVALCLVLIPQFELWGAVVASLASDGLLAVLMWLVVLYKLRAERQISKSGQTEKSANEAIS